MPRSHKPFTFLHDTCQQDSSPFFWLPWELRSHIYDLIFDQRIYVSVAPDEPSARQHTDPGQYMLHTQCPRGTTKIHINAPNSVAQPVCPFTQWSWWHEDHAPEELRCGCVAQGSVRILRTCQRIYFEARSIFFRYMAFEFEAGPFRAFYKDHLCLQTLGFDPVHHLRHLTLRRPTIGVTWEHADFERLRRENFGGWRDTLGILKSPRWNLAHLFLDDWDLTMLTFGVFLPADNPDIHPFRSICQLSNVGQIHATWTAIENDIFHDLSGGNTNNTKDANALKAFKAIYSKALNEITSRPHQPTPNQGGQRGPGTKDLTKHAINQIETTFRKRIEELALQEGQDLMTSQVARSQMFWLWETDSTDSSSSSPGWKPVSWTYGI